MADRYHIFPLREWIILLNARMWDFDKNPQRPLPFWTGFEPVINQAETENSSLNVFHVCDLRISYMTVSHIQNLGRVVYEYAHVFYSHTHLSALQRLLVPYYALFTTIAEWTFCIYCRQMLWKWYWDMVFSVFFCSPP